MGQDIHISKRRWKISIQGYQNIGNRMCYLRWHCAIGDVDPCQNAYWIVFLKNWRSEMVSFSFFSQKLQLL